jgi:hypothetical protein
MKLNEILQGGTILELGSNSLKKIFSWLMILLLIQFWDIKTLVFFFLGVYSTLFIISTILFIKWKRKLLKNL